MFRKGVFSNFNYNSLVMDKIQNRLVLCVIHHRQSSLSFYQLRDFVICEYSDKISEMESALFHTYSIQHFEQDHHWQKEANLLIRSSFVSHFQHPAPVSSISFNHSSFIRNPTYFKMDFHTTRGFSVKKRITVPISQAGWIVHLRACNSPRDNTNTKCSVL